jgi:phosphoribosylformylglycinamidine synthase subunit PurQ / glutaminase
VKAVVVTFPGSNCDQDCFQAVERAGGSARYVWHREQELGSPDLVVIPGGFSYGDYLRPGAIARMSPVMDAVQRFAAQGGAVLGICNGFQILCEAGLLPGALLRNRSLRFQSHDCHLRVETTSTIFTGAYTQGQVLRMPLAHADGNYHAEPGVLAELEGEGRIVFRYVTPAGRLEEGSNPNGSAHNIAGIMNAGGNVLGMMPHPDRAMDPLLGSTDGFGVFSSLMQHFTPVEIAR